MPKIMYEEHTFGTRTMAVVERAIAICEEFAAQGFDLTLRQLFYQFVARGLLPNRQSEYKRLGDILVNARMAGLLDWRYLVDRTRELRKNPHWTSPVDIMAAAARGYARDRWATQPVQPEVWIEKDALLGVIEPVCRRNDVPYFSCRGYTSQSEMWAASQRLLRYADEGRTPLILHLGDHDPSGMGMTEDIDDRLRTFMGGLRVRRLALNMDQVDRYDPPPNPARMTDPRAARYVEEYGTSSWELDALSPTVLDALIQEALDEVKDPDAWAAEGARETTEKRQLELATVRWDTLTPYLADDGSGGPKLDVELEDGTKSLTMDEAREAVRKADEVVRAWNRGEDLDRRLMELEEALGSPDGGGDEYGDD
jgi:hypothetical protein